MSRPDRYTENGSSRDWIDEFCATSTTEEVRGAFQFTIGKYLRRYGKKDDPLQEAIKIQDYATRLVEFEQAALLATAKPVMADDFGQQNMMEASETFSPRDYQFPSPMRAGYKCRIDLSSYELNALKDNGQADKFFADAVAFGIGIMVDGKRVDPGAIFREPQRPIHVCPACGLGHSLAQCNPEPMPTGGDQ